MNQTLNLKNQFGEQSNNVIVGGSSQLWCNFIVDSANGNGLGLRSVKGLVNAKLFMHTSASPAAGSPNPAVGLILVELEKAYAAYVNGTYGFVAPVSGTPINVTSGLTQHAAYIIVSVGTTTPAQWQTLGLPVGVTPAVGVSFIAITASAGSGTGVVEAPATAGSGIDHIEVIGDPNGSINPSTGGAWILLACYSAGVLTAPADGTVIGLTFNLSAGPQSEL